VNRLERFLAATADDSGESITLRALTLHMLEHVAPRLFATRKLKPIQDRALEDCARVEFDFSGDPVRLQAGVDAWYCRFLKGLPHAPPPRARLAAVLSGLALDEHALTPTLSRGERENELLYAWLIGEQAARCGVDVRVPLTPRHFKGTHPLHDAYWLTHLVMLDSDYFAKPLSHPDAGEWGDEFSALEPHDDDLAGEVALCLRFMRRDAGLLLARLRNAPVTEDAHAQATALLALSAE
jgi:hypothetical protein